MNIKQLRNALQHTSQTVEFSKTFKTLPKSHQTELKRFFAVAIEKLFDEAIEANKEDPPRSRAELLVRATFAAISLGFALGHNFVRDYWTLWKEAEDKES